MTRIFPLPSRNAILANSGNVVGAQPVGIEKARLLKFRLRLLIFLGFSVMGAWVPVFSLHLAKLRFSAEQTAWASATSAIGALLAPLVWGQIADRWLAVERCISLCAIASCLGLALLAELEEPALVIGLCIAMWFFLIPVVGLINSFIFRQLEHPEKEYGKIRLWGTIGWIVAGWCLTLWLSIDPIDDGTIDYSDSMRLGAWSALILTFYALTMPHTPPRPRIPDPDGNRSWFLPLIDAPLSALRLFRNPSFGVYVACMFGVNVTIPFTSQLNSLLLDRIGIPASVLPTWLTISQSTEVLMLALLPTLLVRLGMKPTMLVGGLALTFGLSVLSIGSPTGMVLIALASHGVFISCFLVAGQVFVNHQASEDFRASAQSLLIFISGSGLLLGHLAVGWIRAGTDDNFVAAYGSAACLAATLVFVFFLGFSPRPPAPISRKESLVPGSEIP